MFISSPLSISVYILAFHKNDRMIWRLYGIRLSSIYSKTRMMRYCGGLYGIRLRFFYSKIKLMR